MASRERTWEHLAGWASLGAAAVHGALAPAHFDEWWGYGLFFLVTSVLQLVFGLALVIGPFDEANLRMPIARAKAWLYAAGAVGQAMLIAFYVLTRTVGVPAFGPAGGVVEEVGIPDLVAKSLEAVAVAALVRLLVGVRGRASDRSGR